MWMDGGVGGHLVDGHMTTPTYTCTTHTYIYIYIKPRTHTRTYICSIQTCRELQPAIGRFLSALAQRNKNVDFFFNFTNFLFRQEEK